MSSRGNSTKSNSNSLQSIDWKRQTLLVVFSAILGGIVFSFFSPIIVPTINDFQVNQLGVQKPTAGIEVDYAGEINGSNHGLSTNETYSRYSITVTNPSEKPLNAAEFGFMFPGEIEHQRVNSCLFRNSSNCSQSGQLVAGIPTSNFSIVSNAIRIDTLSPFREVQLTFLVDTTPEGAPVPGYISQSRSSYNASAGSIMVSGRYNWQFNGRTYQENQPDTYLNVSQRDEPFTAEVCVGNNIPEYNPG